MSLDDQPLENIDVFDNAKQYWINKLSKCFSESKITDKFIHNSDDFNNYTFNLEEEISDKIYDLSKNNDLSYYVILLTSFKILLFKYTNEKYINIVAPTLKNSNQIYNKHVILSDSLENNMSFKELLNCVKGTVTDGYKNQFYPITKILNYFELENKKYLLNTMFSYKSIHKCDKQLQDQEIINCNLIFTAEKIDKQLSIDIKFNSSYYDDNEVSRMAQFYKDILQQVMSNFNIKIGDIDLISEHDKHKLLYVFNKEYADLPEECTINELFEKQVDKTPDNIALTFMEHKNNNKYYKDITYRELNSRVNKLARYLQKLGVKPGELVGIIMNSPEEIGVGILSILKSGGAYLPIDTAYPNERIDYIIQNSNIKFLLLDTDIQNELIIKRDIQIINVNKIDLSEESELNPFNSLKGDNLAYVIYTSGSTGKPKGVMIEHEGVVNTLLYRKNEYNFNYSDVSIQLFFYAFDGFVTSFFTPLISGIRNIMLKNEDIRDVGQIRDAIVKNSVTHFICVPALYETMLRSFNDIDLNSIKTVILAGDRVPQSIVTETNKRNSNIEVSVEYGVTECSVLSTINRNQQKNGKISIGKPIKNIKAFILNEFNRLQPIGVPGELCISGIGVSPRGYLDMKELTKEKFIPNCLEKDQVLYKTGDIASWSEDGNLIFLGRVDQQIKLRGFRIELEEIENCLKSYLGISEATVAIKSSTNGDCDDMIERYICSYYTCRQKDNDIQEEELRQFMANQLPQYMIPSFFIKMEKLPLNLNGKIDVNALPVPDISMEKVYVAPRDEIDEVLVSIWAEILSIDEKLISIDSNFFNLGGHSLKLTNMVSKIYKELNVKINISDIFENLTIRQLAKYVKNSGKDEYVAIRKAPKQEFYELSSAQKRLYFLQQLNKETTAYNLSSVMAIKGILDIEKLQSAFISLIERHESLRTSFHLVNNEYVQKIHDEVEFEIEYKELNSNDHEIIDNNIQEFMKPFDLLNAPLFRIGLLKKSDKEHILLVNMHHIISDGISMKVFISEFIDIYTNRDLTEVKTQFKDYCLWFNNREKQIEKQGEYWKNKFKESIPVLELPTDYERMAVSDFKGYVMGFELSSHESKALKAMALKEGTTVFMVLLSMYNIFLSKITGQDDIVVGTPIAARRHEDVGNTIGMFVNTLPLRSKIDGEKSFREFLNEVREDKILAFENQEYSYEDLVDDVVINRTANRNPIFDTMFILQNVDMPSLDIPGLKIKPIGFKKGVSKFDLTLQCTEIDDKLVFEFEYATSLFKDSTIQKFIEYFKTMISNIMLYDGIDIKDIRILPNEDMRNILTDFNNTDVNYSDEITVTQLFEKQARNNPHRIAAIFEEDSITYRELDKKVNQLSNHLIKNSVEKGECIAIMAVPSIETIIGILAVLKVGCAYVPIDFNYPQVRKEYIVKNSGTKILLTDSNILEVCRDFEEVNKQLQIINIGDPSIYLENEKYLNVETSKNDIAYIIYTSGSTGKPKGVMVKHQGLINYILWAAKNYVRGEQINFPLYTSLSFDLTVTSIFTPLITGNSIIIYEENNDNSLIKSIFSDKRIGAVKLTPSHFKLIRNSKFENSSIKRVILGGENLSVELANNILSSLGEHVEIYNEYGPTEGTVGCMIHRFSKENDIGKDVPIGVPIDNTQIYVLDKYKKPVPEMVVGEIYISGYGVSKGYVSQENITKERFVDNPFRPGNVMYKTGDLGRINSGRIIDFIGRSDQQVKARGYRIELGEIENHLLDYEGINEAVVIPAFKYNNEDKNIEHLIAYLVSNKEICVSDIRKHLASKIPEYMIPSYYIQINAIPLTHNKKVDIDALPKVDRIRPKLQSDYIEPKSTVEKKIAEIWSEVLRKDNIGVNDNFFELGGNSLDILKVNDKLTQYFGKEIEIAKMFTYPTISYFAKYLSEGEDSIKIYDDEIEAAVDLREQAIFELLGDENE